MRMSVINNEVFLETLSELLSEGTRMAAQGFSLTVGQMQMNGHRCQDPAPLLPLAPSANQHYTVCRKGKGRQSYLPFTLTVM